MDKTTTEELPEGVAPTSALLMLAIVAAAGVLVVGTIARSGAQLGVPVAEVAR